MVNDMLKILVCDDRPEQCERTVRALEGHGNIDVFDGTKLREALEQFFNAISDVLNENSMSPVTELHTAFDGYDIIVMDNNLTALELQGARLTAENVIGYLRAFTNTPYFVSLNKNLFVDFDLRFLIGDYQSLADIALNTKHLSNNWLWERVKPVDGFSPWYWPHLPTAAARRRLQIEFVKERFKESVWDALCFPDTADEYLSMRAKSALKPHSDQSYRDTTFQSFLDASRTLTPAERKTLSEKCDHELVSQAISRVSAYEVDRWVRRNLLTNQDVLIDIPHLVAQMPNLLGEEAAVLEQWNETTHSVNVPFNFEADVYERFLSTIRFSQDVWAPTPCFWWPEVKNNDELMQTFYSSKAEWLDAVFCEDISLFLDLNDASDSSKAREFESEIEGSWGRRYIANVDGVRYSPNSRILDDAP